MFSFRFSYNLSDSECDLRLCGSNSQCSFQSVFPTGHTQNMPFDYNLPASSQRPVSVHNSFGLRVSFKFVFKQKVFLKAACKVDLLAAWIPQLSSYATLFASVFQSSLKSIPLLVTAITSAGHTSIHTSRRAFSFLFINRTAIRINIRLPLS